MGAIIIASPRLISIPVQNPQQGMSSGRQEVDTQHNRLRRPIVNPLDIKNKH